MAISHRVDTPEFWILAKYLVLALSEHPERLEPEVVATLLDLATYGGHREVVEKGLREYLGWEGEL